MSSTDRIDPVTGVHYTGRMVGETGMISYFSRTPDGNPLGTVFCWQGKWSSAYAEDGKHRSLRALTRRMMVRRASRDLDRAINQWIADNSHVVLTSMGMTAMQASSAIRDAVMALSPVTAP